MHRTTLIFILALLLLTFSTVASAATTQPSPADRFFATDRLHTIHIRITPQQWRLLQPIRKESLPRLDARAMPRPSTQPSTRPVLVAAPPTQPVAHKDGERLEPNFYGLQFSYVKADFDCDGQTLRNIGFRLRGNSSFRWGDSNYKHPYKVDFNRYVDGQEFQGLTSFFLNNNAYDPSFLRETLAYETFRNLGVPSPRTTFALVYLTIDGKLNREYIGLYTLLEDADSKDFLKNHFSSSKGLLLKPWSIRGLPYMGETWQPYESRYNPRTDPTNKTARRTIDFIKLVNYADDKTFRAQIESYLNVDEFLRLLAGDVILANLDTFLYTGHNFYMYLNATDDRFYLMPWDMNLSFANFTSAASIEQHLHLSLMRPHTGQMALIDRLLAVPQYNQAYRNIIQHAIKTFFNPEKLFPRIDALQSIIAQSEAAADAAWKAKYTPPTTSPSTQPVKIPPRPPTRLAGWQGGYAIPLKSFITRRIESLTAQLAGETEGFTFGNQRLPSPPSAGLHANPAYGNLPLITFVLMQNADTNLDRKLTRPELFATIRSFFTAADAAKQNSLDSATLTNALARAIQQVPQQRREGQPDRDRGDRRTPQQPLNPAPLWTAAILNTIDTEKTARLTLTQLLAASDSAFTLADQDKSGKLDDAETLHLLDTLAASTPPPPLPPPPPATRPTTRPV